MDERLTHVQAMATRAACVPMTTEHLRVPRCYGADRP